MHVRMRGMRYRAVGGIMTDETRNAASTDPFEGARWRKSRHSGAVGNCVEVAPLADGDIAVRHSRHPNGFTIVYTRAEMAAFMAGVKDGEFDDILG
jgi:hypothetical protein